MSGDEDLAAARAMQDGAGAAPYVHTGGTWVYGDTEGVVDETAPWNPPGLVAWRKPVEDAVLARVSSGGRPVIVAPGPVYGRENRLADVFFVRPGTSAGAIPYIGDGGNHSALVHVDDLAELYVAALASAPGSIYVGVGDVTPTMREIAEAAAHGAGLDGKTVSITLDEARTEMGPIADCSRSTSGSLRPGRVPSSVGSRVTPIRWPYSPRAEPDRVQTGTGISGRVGASAIVPTRPAHPARPP